MIARIVRTGAPSDAVEFLVTDGHDFRLPPDLVGPAHGDHLHKRLAFEDFVKALGDDPHWRRWFTADQIFAVEEALRTDGPGIRGFRWHHHQDHGVMQLVLDSDHRVHHFGGRFTTGGTSAGFGRTDVRVFVARRDVEHALPLVEHFKKHGRK
jgi:hypothetical protein